MSEIAARYAPNTGIEQVSVLTVAETGDSLPSLLVLQNGQAVTANTEQLYPANSVQRQMMAFADPTDALLTCWRPDAFRQALLTLQACLAQHHTHHSVLPAIVLPAIDVLEQLNKEQSLLQTTLNILHRV